MRLRAERLYRRLVEAHFPGREDLIREREPDSLVRRKQSANWAEEGNRKSLLIRLTWVKGLSLPEIRPLRNMG